MPQSINKIFSDKSSGDVTQYKGKKGDIFYDPSTDVLRISDGITPGGKKASTSINQVFPTYASITNPVTNSIIIVTADETNGGLVTLYFYDGTTFNWLPMV